MSNKIKLLALVTALIVLSVKFNDYSSNKFTISDAESVGFKKESKQYYQLIGAVDGWDGLLAGDKVELYQYPSASLALEQLSSAWSDDWTEKCVKGNLFMLSKGSDACKKLKELK